MATKKQVVKKVVLTKDQKAIGKLFIEKESLKQDLNDEAASHRREVAGLHFTIESLKKTIGSQELEIDKLEDKVEIVSHNLLQVQKGEKSLEEWREINLNRIRTQYIAMELMAQEIDKLRKNPKMMIDD